MWQEILKFELIYRAKRWDTYLYFLALFGYALIAVDFLFGQDLEAIKINAPYLIALTMGIVSALFMMMVSMVMGVAALREFDHNMESIMFINPIKKSDYLIGRFLGSFVVLLFIFSGLFLGLIVADFMPWRIPENQLPFAFWKYLQPTIFIVLPNLFFGSALFFISGALSRKLLVVYTQGILLLIVYIITIQLTQNNDYRYFAIWIDPFGYQTIKDIVRYWSVAERNKHMIPISSQIICNRLIWMGISGIILLIGYYKFTFNVVRDKLKVKNKVVEDSQNRYWEEKNITKSLVFPKLILAESMLSKLKQLLGHSLFYAKSILRETPFWAIVICGMAIIFINSISLGTVYGVDSYPLTFVIVEELQEMSIFFFLIVLILYTGELVWIERDTQINGIYDVLPVSNLIVLGGKLIGLLLIYVVLMVAIVLAGLVFQTTKGYFNFEIAVYFQGFFIEIYPYLVLLTMMGLFFQVLVNHKFVGHLLVVSFLFFVLIGAQMLEINHGLYSYGSGDLGQYSDMNGYGHYWKPYCWFMLYWLAFSTLLFLVSVLLMVRGMETGLKKRWVLSKGRRTFFFKKLSLGVVLLFIISGSTIFYNTNIINTYSPLSIQREFRAKYEKELKAMEFVPQPKITDVKLKVELYPYKRNYSVDGTFTLTNMSDTIIPIVYIQKMPTDAITLEEITFSSKTKVDSTHQVFGFYAFILNKPLQFGDSIKMDFIQNYTTQGFTESKDKRMVYNGTFFDNAQLPTLGYNAHFELEEEEDRFQYGLPPRAKTAGRTNAIAIKLSQTGEDSKIINFEATIGTAIDQIAVAPGQLQKKWTKNQRNYFYYKSTKPIINFYPITSARYQLLKDEWISSNNGSSTKPIKLEVFYHKGHEYNLERMIEGMKKSFSYFTQNFSPYPYRQMKIVETPRYLDRAQSFPTMITYSESMGFIMQVDEETVDMPFFITAHEVAHQWWGGQLAAANVQGKKMILESLAQYSALMVFKDAFSNEKVQQLLDLERNRYFDGRGSKAEEPLVTENNQSHIYYSKGALNLYALQSYISEDSVNLALQRFIRDWNSFDGTLAKEKYATTIELLDYFREVTPDSLQYILADLFDRVILFENSIESASYEKIGKNSFQVNVDLTTKKFEIDSLDKETIIPINDWINIGIYGKDHVGRDSLIYLKKYQFLVKETSLNINLDQLPTKVVIDPQKILIEEDYMDNARLLLLKY